MSDDDRPADDGGSRRDDAPAEDRPITEEPMTETVDETDDGTDHEGSDESRDPRRTLNYVLLAGLSLLALIATLQLYFSVSSAINQWVTHEYRPLFQAAFSLVVLLLVGSAMVWQVRQLQE